LTEGSEPFFGLASDCGLFRRVLAKYLAHAFMMNLRDRVLFLLFLPGGARRSVRIGRAHYDAQRQNNTLASGLDVSAEAQDEFFPAGFGMRASYRAGPQTSTLTAGSKQDNIQVVRAVPHFRFGPRRAKAMLAMAATAAPPAGFEWSTVPGCDGGSEEELTAAAEAAAEPAAAEAPSDYKNDYRIEEIPAAKASVLLFTWSRAANDMRAQGFNPASEAVGDRALFLKALVREFPKLISTAKVLGLLERGSLSYENLEEPHASMAQRLSKTKVMAALSVGKGSAIAFVSTWEDHVSIDACMINPSYLTASEEAELALLRHIVEEARAAGCGSVRYRPIVANDAFYAKSGFSPADGDSDGTLYFRGTKAGLDRT